MKINHLILTLLALFFFILFISLGCWQLRRGHEKEHLLALYAARVHAPPRVAAELLTSSDHRFYLAKLEGSFDNAHSFLLDNKIYEGTVGYELYTPFHAQGIPNPILIDRGFLPLGTDREHMPAVRPIRGKLTLIGMLNLPPRYVAFGNMAESNDTHFPLRVEYINLNEISALQAQAFFPYILSLAPHDPLAYPIQWQITVMPPSRHFGYALQWFAFAATLLILFVSLNRKTGKISSKS